MASRRKILPGLTRREWTTLFAASPLLAQTATPPATAPKAISDVQQTSQRLAEIEIPMNIEPSFRFSA